MGRYFILPPLVLLHSFLGVAWALPKLMLFSILPLLFLFIFLWGMYGLFQAYAFIIFSLQHISALLVSYAPLFKVNNIDISM
jgi:hypothetical protein